MLRLAFSNIGDVLTIEPSFAKIVILTPDSAAREALKYRSRKQIANGLAPEARVRVTQLVFGPPSPFPVAFRVMGPDPAVLRDIADNVQKVIRANPHMRQVNRDWTQRVPTARFILDQDRCFRLEFDSGVAFVSIDHPPINLLDEILS
jgi:multidrug efflux pump subunit AcrB